MVRAEVYRPIGVQHAPAMHCLEADGSRGVPLLSYGLYPTIDDVAKVVTLLQSGGKHQGQQLLSPTRLAQALYRTPDMGLPTGGVNQFGEARYQLSFWSVPYRTATGCAVQVPYMLGFGGNIVALLPNGVSAFRFADGDHYDLEAMVLAGEAVRPMCPPPAGGSPAPAPRAPLGAAAARAALAGRTFQLGPVRLVVAADGIVYSSTGESVDVGTWSITPDGGYCRVWNVGDNRHTRCFTVYGDGETLELHTRGRWGKFVLRRVP